MEGFELGARFSLATNRLNYCGPADAEPTLYRAIVEGVGRTETEGVLSRFEALYPYLEAIGRKHGRDPFDREVVEAYWIGNELLEGFTVEEFRGLLAALVRRGLPDFLARELAERLPPDPLPHHVFHVAFVGVGAVTGHVETTRANMEACRPAWAEVLDVGRGTLRVRAPALEGREGSWRIGAAVEGEVRFDPRMTPNLRVGDTVARHWGWACLTLTPIQLDRLRRTTARALASANAARPG
jgi:hypothetical protein